MMVDGNSPTNPASWRLIGFQLDWLSVRLAYSYGLASDTIVKFMVEIGGKCGNLLLVSASQTETVAYFAAATHCCVLILKQVAN